MPSALTLDLLTLLALGALADEKLPDIEVKKFAQAARILLPDDDKLTLPELESWLRDNRQRITEQYNGPERLADIQSLFLRLSKGYKRSDIKDGLAAISHSDGEYDLNEKALISLMDAYWS